MVDEFDKSFANMMQQKYDKYNINHSECGVNGTKRRAIKWLVEGEVLI